MTILTYGLGDRQNEGDHSFLDRSDGHPSVSQIHSYIRNPGSVGLRGSDYNFINSSVLHLPNKYRKFRL